MKNSVFVIGSILIGTCILFIPPNLLMECNLTKPLVFSAYSLGFIGGCVFNSIIEWFGKIIIKYKKY